MRILFFLIGAFLVLPAQLSGEESKAKWENPVFGPDYAASLLEALLLNNRSIDRFDVLFTREILSVDPDGEVGEFKTKFRICRDRDKGIWLVVSALQSDVWKGDKEPVSSKRVVGLVVTPNGKAYLRSPDGIREISQADVQMMPTYIGCPTFLTLGLETFPDTNTLESSGDSFWDRVFLGQNGLSSQPGLDGQVIVRLEIPNTDSDPVDYKWIFDAATMLPRLRETAITFQSSGERRLKGRDNIQWMEISGVNVPLSIYRSKLQTVRARNGKRVVVEIIDNTEFIWNQVGTELNDTLFTLEHFRSIDPGEFLQIP